MGEGMISAEEASDPRWAEERGRVHNWRSHVGVHTRAIWHTLSVEQQIAIATDAQHEADGEEWD